MEEGFEVVVVVVAKCTGGFWVYFSCTCVQLGLIYSKSSMSLGNSGNVAPFIAVSTTTGQTLKNVEIFGNSWRTYTLAANTQST